MDFLSDIWLISLLNVKYLFGCDTFTIEPDKLMVIIKRG